MDGKDRAFVLHFIEQILDLAGAAGHDDWTCAKKLEEPVFQSYRNVYDVTQNIIHRRTSCIDSYRIILDRKYVFLRHIGFKINLGSFLGFCKATQRIMCLDNAVDADSALLQFIAFNSFDCTRDTPRDRLCSGLNNVGTVQRSAVQVTYTPAMLTKGKRNPRSGRQDNAHRGSACDVKISITVYDTMDNDLARMPFGVTAVERDLRGLAPVLDSDEFRTDPDVLDKHEVPPCQVANIAPEGSDL
jgi:hypothetical protein